MRRVLKLRHCLIRGSLIVLFSRCIKQRQLLCICAITDIFSKIEHRQTSKHLQMMVTNRCSSPRMNFPWQSHSQQCWRQVGGAEKGAMY